MVRDARRRSQHDGQPNSLPPASPFRRCVFGTESRAARHRGSPRATALHLATISAAHRRHLHLAEPRADVGGQARIGSNRGEFRGLAGADLDAGIGHQPVGGGDHVAGTQRGVERKIDRGEAGGIAAVAGAVRAQRLAIGEGVFAVGIALAIAGGRAIDGAAEEDLGRRLPDKTPGTSEPASRCRAPSAENTCRRSCARKMPARSRRWRRARRRRGLLVEAERIGEEIRLRRGLCCCCFWSPPNRKSNRPSADAMRGASATEPASAAAATSIMRRRMR